MNRNTTFSLCKLFNFIVVGCIYEIEDKGEQKRDANDFVHEVRYQTNYKNIFALLPFDWKPQSFQPSI